MTDKQRLDELLVARGLVSSRKEAKAQVMAGNVLVDDCPAEKAGHRYPADAAVRLRKPPEKYVSRGGLKLEGALDDFTIDVTGFRVLDAGASTGGFTDCLLQRGAAHVAAVDVGRGQLAHSLRVDERVAVVEKCNIRFLAPGHFGELFDLVVGDLSFISLRLVMPALTAQLRPGGQMLLLVKPQFEVGRQDVGRGGIVKDEAKQLAAVEEIGRVAREQGLAVMGSKPSRLTGTKGNREYFIYLAKPQNNSKNS